MVSDGGDTRLIIMFTSISGVCGKRSLLVRDCNISLNIYVLTYVIPRWFQSWGHKLVLLYGKFIGVSLW